MLIAVLQRVQEKVGYLPEDAMTDDRGPHVSFD